MKNLLILIVILVVAIVLIWAFSGSSSDVATDGAVLDDAGQQLDGLDLGQLDNEFQAIDSNLQTL